MPLTNAELSAILTDTSKRIHGDINWSGDEYHSPAQRFRSEISSSAGWPLFVQGYYNPYAMSLSYAIVLKTIGRIYGLDLGKDHRNPHGEQIDGTHKHKWSERYRDKQAYAPNDITAPVSRPVAVWRQFCTEACLEHDGVLAEPVQQEDLFL